MSGPRAPLLVEAGLWLRLCGQPEGARALLERALEAEPSNPLARELLERLAAREPEEGGSALAPFERRDPPPLRRVAAREEPAPVPTSNAWDQEREGAVVIPLELAPRDQAGGADALDLLASEERAKPKPVPRPPPAPQPAAQRPAQAEGPARELERLLQGVKDMLALDDHTSALELVQRAEKLAPGDERVAAARQRCERTLLAMLESRLGDMRRKPRVKLRPDEIIWLKLDHRAGFVLAQIDGMVSYEDLFVISGMSRLDTARILVQLIEQGAITG